MREGVTRDVLIANQIVGPGKAARAAALAQSCDLIVAVDSQYGLDDLSSAAVAAGVEVGVLVDVNVGHAAMRHRAGRAGGRAGAARSTRRRACSCAA